MERYGVVSEGELMSGHIVTIKNRISDKEVDDMNLYNTNQVGRRIGARIGGISGFGYVLGNGSGYLIRCLLEYVNLSK